MRVALLLATLMLPSMPALPAGADRPIGKNCALTAPPASAGEEMSHGMTLRIYPRAKNIDSHYTGCQVVLAPDGKKWVTVALTEILNGDPVRVWSAHSDDHLACRYKHGKVMAGNADKCPAPEFILMKSMAPGCIRRVEDSVAKQALGASWPAECQYQ